MDKEKNYQQFKQLTNRQNFHSNRSSCFLGFFEKLKTISDFDELKTCLVDQLKTACIYNLIKKRQIIHYPKYDLVDQVSRSLLIKSNLELFDIVPVSIIGDGNCLFRSLSKALYGKEDYHPEVRYRTLVQAYF